MATTSSNSQLMPLGFALGVVLGGMLVVAGLAWSAYATPDLVWSESQAMRYQTAARAMHGHCCDQHHREGCREEDCRAEREDVATKFQEIAAELHSAQSRAHGLGNQLLRAGLITAACSGFGLIFLRNES